MRFDEAGEPRGWNDFLVAPVSLPPFLFLFSVSLFFCLFLVCFCSALLVSFVSSLGFFSRLCSVCGVVLSLRCPCLSRCCFGRGPSLVFFLFSCRPGFLLFLVVLVSCTVGCGCSG